MAGYSSQLFGKLNDGRPVRSYTLENQYLQVDLLDYGVRLKNLRVKINSGEKQETVLGYDSLREYEQDRSSMGAVVGRFANRIRGAKYNQAGADIQLERNHGDHHIHGGESGFANQLWQCREEASGLVFSLESVAQHAGFPGNLSVSVRITLDERSLSYEYQAVSDADTIINLTNHAYFNLLGRDSSVLDHELLINANSYLPVDDDLLPTGEISAVSGTPFDFSQPQSIGERIDEANDQLERGSGYDHCYVLNTSEVASQLYCPVNGLGIRIKTTEPGLQLYTGNHLPRGRTAVCLETQHFPDSPNQSGFPSTFLPRGVMFTSETTYCVYEAQSPSLAP